MAAGLAAILRDEPSLGDVARLDNGTAVLGALDTHVPDLLILDAGLPPSGGLSVLRALREARNAVRVLILPTAMNAQQHLEAMRLGVAGVLPLDLSVDMYLPFIRNAIRGEAGIAPRMDAERGTARPRGVDRLTARELDVARLVARGLRNRQIAEHFGITEGTVKVHISGLFRKLALRSRLELLDWAHNNGIH